MVWESIRKFGLDYCDLPTMLWNVGFFLRLVSLNINRRNKPIPKFIHIWMGFTWVCYFYVYFFCMAWFVFWYCPQQGEILPAIVVFSLGMASESGTNKLLFMYYYREEIMTLVDGCLACDSEVEHDSRFMSNMLRNLRVVKKRAIIFWTVLMVNGVIYTVKPLLMPGRHYAEDVFVFYALRPMHDSPNYEINFFVQAIAIYIACYLPANIISFFIIVTGNIEAQMLALSEELTHLWDDAVEHCLRSRDIKTGDINDKEELKAINAYIKKHLENMVRIHTNNLNLLRQIEYIFKGPNAVQFTLLITGLIAELLGGLEHTWLQVPYAMVMVGADCLTGQRVMDASITFEKAVYDSKWENFDVINRKIVLLMLQSAQKPMKLSAGGVITLSFQSFMSVIRSIYSAYTTLRSTMK